MDKMSSPVRLTVLSDPERIIYEDPRIDHLSIAQLAALYEAVNAASDALFLFYRDVRVEGSVCEDILGDLGEMLRPLGDSLNGRMECRRPMSGEHWDRSKVLLSDALRAGVSIAAITDLARSLSTEAGEND